MLANYGSAAASSCQHKHIFTKEKLCVCVQERRTGEEEGQKERAEEEERRKDRRRELRKRRGRRTEGES